MFFVAGGLAGKDKMKKKLGSQAIISLNGI